MRTAATDAFWRAFRDASGLDHDRYEVVAFGDSPSMIDELAGLVVIGRKRATASLLRGYQTEPVPAVGDWAVVVDGDGRPLCIYRVTEIRIGPLSSVDGRFAYDEGEGDRSRATWLAGHHAVFNRWAAAGGFAMHDDIETVFERFAVAWPPSLAD